MSTPDCPSGDRDDASRHEVPAVQHYNSARLALREGNRPLAIQSLTSAIEHDPSNALYWYVRGLVHLESGNASACEADFRSGATCERSRCADVTEALEAFRGDGRRLLERFRPQQEPGLSRPI